MLSVPVLIMAGITFYVGVYHLLIYLRQKQQREHFTFALSCLAMGLYDLLTAGLYNVSSPTEGVHWQRAQVATLALVAIAFAWFVFDHLAPTSAIPVSTKRVLLIFSIYFFLAAVTGMVDRSGLYRPMDQPAVQEISLFGRPITYYGMSPGPLTNLQSIVGLAAFVYLLWITVRVYRSGYEKETRPLLLAMALFFASTVNDTAVTSGLYPFVYTLEYASLGMVLLMTYSLTSSVLETAMVKQTPPGSEAKTRALLHAIPDMIFEVAQDGTFLSFLPAQGLEPAMLPDRFIGKNLQEVMPPPVSPRTMQAIRQALRTGEVQTFEYELVTDGRKRDYEARVVVSGENAALAIVRDITEHKLAQTERERLLADLMHRGTQLVAAAEVSKAANTILDPEELISETVDQIQQRFHFYYVGLFLVDEAGEYAVLHAGTGEPGQRMLEAGHRLTVGGPSMVGQCLAHAEVRIALDVGVEAVRFNNPLLPETRSEMALPLISRGQCMGALTVQSSEEAAFSPGDVAALQTIVDQLAIAITNARLYDQIQRYATQLEERVAERTAELAAVNQELEAFAYSVSHDLRAPLRSMDGFSQALLEDYASQLDATGQDYLRRVQASSQRMRQLIDDLLKLSRLTRGQIHHEIVNLSALAQEIAVELHQTQPERQIQFVIAEGAIASGDARLLRVVLENLLGNAFKFTSKQTCARIEFGYTEVEGQPVYFVRDDGAGFDMAYVDKLFGAFQRLHAAAEFEGSGIGLATVQRIIYRHGGRVWAEGAVDQGATFYFTLAAKGEVKP